MIGAEASAAGGREVWSPAHDGSAEPDGLSIDLIRRNLTTDRMGRRICLFAGVSSTNSVLRELALRGEAEGTVVLAEEQHRGRGRPGKPWFSPPGRNLYVSVLLRPAITLRELPVFSFVASLALSETIWGEGLPATIKWPNDVLVDGKKVGGALVESADSGEEPAFVILGMGVNMNVDEALLQAGLGETAGGAIALRQAAGRDIDRNLFAAGLLNRLDRWAGVYRARGPRAILEAWRERDALAGRRVAVLTGASAGRQGRAVGVDADGYLVLEEADGRRRRLVTGEIKVLD